MISNLNKDPTIIDQNPANVKNTFYNRYCLSRELGMGVFRSLKVSWERRNDDLSELTKFFIRQLYDLCPYGSNDILPDSEKRGTSGWMANAHWNPQRQSNNAYFNFCDLKKDGSNFIRTYQWTKAVREEDLNNIQKRPPLSFKELNDENFIMTISEIGYKELHSIQYDENQHQFIIDNNIEQHVLDLPSRSPPYRVFNSENANQLEHQQFRERVQKLYDCQLVKDILYKREAILRYLGGQDLSKNV